MSDGVCKLVKYRTGKFVLLREVDEFRGRFL